MIVTMCFWGDFEIGYISAINLSPKAPYALVYSSSS